MNDPQHIKLDDLTAICAISDYLRQPSSDGRLYDMLKIAMQMIDADDTLLISYPLDAPQVALGQEGIIHINQLPATLVPLHCGMVERVAQSGHTERITDLTADAACAEIITNASLRSVICVPVRYAEQTLAVLVMTHPTPDYFTSYHETLLELVANQITGVLVNIQKTTTMQHQQRQLDGLLDAFPDSVLILNAQGELTQANQRGLASIGLDAPLTNPLPLRQFMAGRIYIQKIVELIEETVDNPLLGRPMLTLEVRSEDALQDLDISISLWQDPEHSNYGYVVVLHDVTDLRDLLRFKNEMLRLAAHDLRTPLNLIVGYADMIAMDVPNRDSSVHHHVEVIQRSTRRISDLLEDLLRVEQIRHSPMERHESINPSSLIKIVLVNCRPQAATKHITLETDTTPDMPNIRGDRVLIRQAMENLIHNAIKYTPEGGTVIVRAYYESDGFYFEVEDNGIGIMEDKLPFVFEAFYRAQQVEDRPVDGTGLGLNIVKTVIDRHNGRVTVESTPGQGSRFGFWIPQT